MGRSGVVKRFYLEKYKITEKQITICYLLYRHRWNTRIFPVTKIWYPVRIQFLSLTCEVITVVMATSVWANRKIASRHLAICLYNKQNITCSLVDTTNFIFSCSNQYLSDIYSWTLEDKIRIFRRTCNILYILNITVNFRSSRLLMP